MNVFLDICRERSASYLIKTWHNVSDVALRRCPLPKSLPLSCKQAASLLLSSYLPTGILRRSVGVLKIMGYFFEAVVAYQSLICVVSNCNTELDRLDIMMAYTAVLYYSRPERFLKIATFRRGRILTRWLRDATPCSENSTDQHLLTCSTCWLVQRHTDWSSTGSY